MLSSRPASIMCDIGKWFITCYMTQTVACSFGDGMQVYALVSSPFLDIMCVCVTDKKKRIFSVVKSSHIGKAWYLEGVYHLQGDTMCCMQFCCWRVIVFPYFILLPLHICEYVCVFNHKIKNIKKLSVVNSSQITKVWYWEGIYYLLRDTNCRMQFWCWSMSVFPCLIPFHLYIWVFVCVY